MVPRAGQKQNILVWFLFSYHPCLPSHLFPGSFVQALKAYILSLKLNLYIVGACHPPWDISHWALVSLSVR